MKYVVPNYVTGKQSKGKKEIKLLLDKPTRSLMEKVYVRREVVFIPVFHESSFEDEIREILSAHSRRIATLERRIHSLSSSEHQFITSSRDPPCVVCGTWSEDWLCPRCRQKYPWMRP